MVSTVCLYCLERREGGREGEERGREGGREGGGREVYRGEREGGREINVYYLLLNPDVLHIPV